MSGDDSQFNLGADTSARWANVVESSDKAKRDAIWGGYGLGGTTGSTIDTDVRKDLGNYDQTQDVDQIIEKGRPALDWFHLVQARYALTRHTMPAGMPLGSQSQIDDLYNQQKDMKVNPLFGAGQRITAVLGQIQTAHDDQKNATGQLANHWQGPTGTSAQDKLNELGIWSDDTIDEIKTLPGVISHAVDEIKKAVQIKVDAFGKLIDVRMINGVSMTNSSSSGQGINTNNGDDDSSDNDDVSMIINYGLRVGIGDNVRWRIGELADKGVFGANRGGLEYYSSGMGALGRQENKIGSTFFDNEAQPLCQIWTQHFIESAEGYFGAYKTLCDQTDTAIQGYLKVVVDALNQAGHRKRAPTPNQPSVSSSSGSGISTSSYTATSGTGVGSGTDSSGSGTASTSGSGSASTSGTGVGYSGSGVSWTGTSGTSTITSAFNNLASGLSGLGTLVQTAESAASQLSGIGSALNQSITQGLSGFSTLGTQIQQGLDGFLGTHNTSGTSGKAVAEFDVAGNKLKLEQGKNGALELVLSDSDGKGKSYTLKLDEHGVPVITAEDAGASGPQSASDSRTTSGSHSSSGSYNSSESGGASGSSASSSLGGHPGDQTSNNQNFTTQQPKTETPSTDSRPTVAPVTSTQKDQSKDNTTKNQTPGSSSQSSDSGAELPEAGPL